MRTLFLLFIGLEFFSLSTQQVSRFKILQIKEYPDGVLLKTIDSLKGDTVNIISASQSSSLVKKSSKTEVGKAYSISVKKLTRSQAYLSQSFTIRIKETVVWKNGDPIKEIPVVATNINGLYLIQ